MIGVARNALLALLACLACLGPLAAQAPAVIDAAPVTATRIEAVAARQGMVVAQEGRAARIGVEVLEQGGNAVDAAVATGFALAVTYPRAGNIGGGGYMVIHFAGGQTATAIDYRETAPAATTRDIFLDERGDADPRKSQDSALAIGVPGTVAGLALAHAKYGSGKFTLAQLLAPAIALARDGIPIENDIADSLPRSQSRLARWPATTKIFFADGRPLAPGATLLQRDLADTLTAIAREGPAGFYRGAVADKLVAAVRAAGGIMTREDLKNYQPIERTPTSGSYRGYRIVSMPPSSSGGVALVEMLNILEGYRLGEVDAATRVHLMVEAMKRAYFDRAKFLGDPASVTPPAYLTSKRFAESLRARIDPARATAAASFGSIFAPAREGDNTTHFSVVDRFGNVVAVTYTLNSAYGVGAVAAGAGFLWNNNMDNFSAKAGAPNQYGMLGAAANAVEAGKRPLSSMTPTIVRKDGKFLLTMGSPGGPTIINTVLQVYLNVTVWGMDVSDAIDESRIHHQWLPDQIDYEDRALSPDTIAELERMGYTLHRIGRIGQAMGIMRTPEGYLAGAADRRGSGLALGY